LTQPTCISFFHPHHLSQTHSFCYLFVCRVNIYRGFDPPIDGDVNPQGAKDNKITDWWAITHFVPSATESALTSLRQARPAYAATLDWFLQNAKTVVRYQRPLYETSVTRGVALTQPDGTISGPGGLKVNNIALAPYNKDAQVTPRPDVMQIEVQYPPHDEKAHSTVIEVRGVTTAAGIDQANKDTVANLNVQIVPLRLVPIGLWYLEDGDPGTPDEPPSEYRNGEKVLEKLNKTFWQTRVLFVPALPTQFDANGKPAFEKLEMQYGEVRQGGVIRELDFRDTPDTRVALGNVRDRVSPPGLPKKLNIVVVGHVASVPLPGFQAEGITFLGDTCFIQSELATTTPRRVFPPPGPPPANAADMQYGDNVIKDDYYKIFAHEVGHALGLSTRHPSPGSILTAYDQSDFPFCTYNFDGTPVAGTYPIEDINPNILLLPPGAPINGNANHKRRSRFPLMFQSILKPGDLIGTIDAVPMPGNGLRSLWIRHEDWEPANLAAKTYQEASQ